MPKVNGELFMYIELLTDPIYVYMIEKNINKAIIQYPLLSLSYGKNVKTIETFNVPDWTPSTKVMVST